jgi:hypothetical protein
VVGSVAAGRQRVRPDQLTTPYGAGRLQCCPSRSSAATAPSRITVVTGSDPVSPTSNIPSQQSLWCVFCAGIGLTSRPNCVGLSLAVATEDLLMAAASPPAVKQLGGRHAFGVSATRHRHDR